MSSDTTTTLSWGGRQNLSLKEMMSQNVARHLSHEIDEQLVGKINDTYNNTTQSMNSMSIDFSTTSTPSTFSTHYISDSYQPMFEGTERYPIYTDHTTLPQEFDRVYNYTTDRVVYTPRAPSTIDILTERLAELEQQIKKLESEKIASRDEGEIEKHRKLSE